MEERFRKWQCFFCGEIYDEELGHPESDLGPGTRWEDVPNDWVCPGCGAMKFDFILMEV